MTLQRLIISFKSEEITMHVLYRTKQGPTPGRRHAPGRLRRSPGAVYETPWKRSRPAEERAWNSYTEAYQENSQSNDVLNVLGRGLAEQALSSDPASGIAG